MGKTIVTEKQFPEIIELYNNEGKSAAYDLIRNRYGISHPNTVINRIKKCGKYAYSPDRDCFSGSTESVEDAVFMGMDELCDTTAVRATKPAVAMVEVGTDAVEKMIRELISDRLLTLSRYIKLESSTRRILIDKTSLTADGYQVVTH